MSEHHRKLERMYLSAPVNRIYSPTIEISEGRAVVEFEIGIASVDGGGADGATISNSILWANAVTGASNQVSAGTSVSWSDVQGGAAGTGNIDVDPLFWSLFAGDFALQPGSPAIDAGDPVAATDPDGSRADMGAFPFDPNHVSPPFTYCSGKPSSVRNSVTSMVRSEIFAARSAHSGSLRSMKP